VESEAHFQEVARKYLDSLYNYARVLCRDDAEAEDLLQETLLRGFRGAAGLRPGVSPKPWLFAIMRNAHIDRCRRARVRPVCEPLSDETGVEATGAHGPPDAAPLDPEQILLRRIAIEEVRAAIRRLPGPCREVVELRDIEGLSYREIAQVLRRPIGTVMSRLYRGRNLLRAFLEGQPNPANSPERVGGL
jgi:RNA polymerase sigma-70 factor (ECF subfamily)